ncbi:MAG: pyruvate kinase [archaeon]
MAGRNAFRVLELLSENADKSFNVNQIARLLGISVGSAFKILKEFEKQKLVGSASHENQLLYCFKNSPKALSALAELEKTIADSSFKKTKILCTIGPASADRKTIARLIEKGMDAARLNASHCTEDSALKLVNLIRSVSKEVPILLDIPGPKIRLTAIEAPVNVAKGQKVVFVKSAESPGKGIPLPNEQFFASVKKGDKIFIDDGKLCLVAEKVSQNEIVCRSAGKGTIAKNKGVNCPDTKFGHGGISAVDRKWAEFAAKNDLEFVGYSFVRTAEDVKSLNEVLGYGNLNQVISAKTKVIAKIETKEAIANYKEIIKEAYGIMIDRGDLGSETAYELVPKMQKKIVLECNRVGKPVIIATHMLESMIESNQASKAEISDIANAVLDGASCLMLSAETAIGRYPLEAVETMSKVIKAMEGDIKPIENGSLRDVNLTNAIGKAIYELEKMLEIDATIVLTSGGYSARMIASHMPLPKIIAATSNEKIFRQLNILWGVCPLLISKGLDDISNEHKKEAILKAMQKGYIGKRSVVVITGSVFNSGVKKTNLLEVHRVSEFLDYLEKSQKGR